MIRPWYGPAHRTEREKGMTPAIVDKPEFIVAGIRTVLELGDVGVGSLWRDKLVPRHGEIAAVDSRYYAVFNPLVAPDDNRFEYVAGMAVVSLENIPVGMVGWVVPFGTYAETRATGMADLAKVCRSFIADWLPDSGYKLAASPIFAFTDSAKPDAEGTVWTVCIPIETPEEFARFETWLG